MQLKYSNVESSIQHLPALFFLCKAVACLLFPCKVVALTEEGLLNEPVHEISNNVVCGTSKASDQPAHMCSLIRAIASRLNIL